MLLIKWIWNFVNEKLAAMQIKFYNSNCLNEYFMLKCKCILRVGDL